MFLRPLLRNIRGPLKVPKVHQKLRIPSPTTSLLGKLNLSNSKTETDLLNVIIVIGLVINLLSVNRRRDRKFPNNPNPMKVTVMMIRKLYPENITLPLLLIT